MKTVKMISKARGGLLITINLVLFCVLIGIFLFYGFHYRTQLYQQNVQEIESKNRSCAEEAKDFLDIRQQKLVDIAHYIQSEPMSESELINFLKKLNEDKNCNIQLLGSDYCGYAIQNLQSQRVDYSHNSYTGLQKLVDEMNEGEKYQLQNLPEFTDQLSGNKSFGFYTYVELVNVYQKQTYMLILSTQSKLVNDMFSFDGEYEKLSTALVDDTGKYLICRTEYKSDNFYTFLHDYAGISVEEQRHLKKKMQSASSGSFEYSNGIEACMYVYSKIQDSNWYCISFIPISEFNKNRYDFAYLIIITFIFLGLLGLNVIWLMTANNRIRRSMEQERISNNAKSDFLSRMSHDLRTPLNGIIGVAGLAKEDIACAEKMQQHIDDIDHAGKFMLGLVNDILDMAKIESGKMELDAAPYSCKEFIDVINTMFVPLCREKGITFDCSVKLEPNTTDCWVLTDKMRLQQIFFNLLSNAVKFTPKGGTVVFYVVNQVTDDGHLLVNFTVKDTGCGMSEEFLPHIYETFSQERTKSSDARSGSGLGLPIVKSIVDMFGGTIQVKSEVGKGTEFKISIVFTMTKAGTEKQNQINQTKLENILVGKHILLCEDHPLNAKIAKRLLDKMQITWDYAENGRQAMEMVEASSPGTYNLILMDVRMPVMDGLEATRRIRTMARWDVKSVPIVAMTANAFAEDVKDCLNAGMNAHLSKPIDPQKLYETMAKLLDRNGSSCSEFH